MNRVEVQKLPALSCLIVPRNKFLHTHWSPLWSLKWGTKHRYVGNDLVLKLSLSYLNVFKWRDSTLYCKCYYIYFHKTKRWKLYELYVSNRVKDPRFSFIGLIALIFSEFNFFYWLKNDQLLKFPSLVDNKPILSYEK